LNKFGNVVSMYEGQFINGSLSKGVYTNNVDNSIYDGEFKNDKKDGQGTLSLLDGSYTYNGILKMVKGTVKESKCPHKEQ